MKVRLAYDKELELPKLATMQDRSKYIIDNIFNNIEQIGTKEENVTYESYYNLSSTRITDDQIENIRKRWIGIKPVNQQYPDISFKVTLDYLAGYLLNAGDYSIKKHYGELIKLDKKKNNQDKQLSDEEKNRYNKLLNNTLFYKALPDRLSNNNIIFMVNHQYEQFMMHRIKQLRNTLSSEEFIVSVIDVESTIKRLLETLEACQGIRSKCVMYVDEIMSIVERMRVLKKEITDEYQYYRENKTEVDICIITALANAKELVRLKEKKKYLEHLVQNLSDDYRLCTELTVDYGK